MADGNPERVLRRVAADLDRLEQSFFPRQGGSQPVIPIVAPAQPAASIGTSAWQSVRTGDIQALGIVGTITPVSNYDLHQKFQVPKMSKCCRPAAVESQPISSLGPRN